MRKVTGLRRTLAAALVSCAVCLMGLTGTNPARAAETVTLNLYISGDTNIFDLWKKGFLPAFAQRYPKYRTNMVELLHGNGAQGVLDKILAAKRAGRTTDVDLWETEPSYVDQGIPEGLWARLNARILPSLD